MLGGFINWFVSCMLMRVYMELVCVKGCVCLCVGEGAGQRESSV